MTKIFELLDLLKFEVSDEEKDDVLTRKKCARIIHEFLQKKISEPDETDIEKAYVIKDLFDCRVCANHIAQVYLKGIMDAFDLGQELVLFLPDKEVGTEQMRVYADRAINPSNREKP